MIFVESGFSMELVMTGDTVRWIFLPYCLQRLADGRYIILNRRYKPLGVQSTEWVTYETHPSVIHLPITSSIAKKMSWSGSEDTNAIYLYNDGCVPTDEAKHMRAYSDRLEVLMKLKTGAS
jgi:hypothetical protein